MAVFFATLFGNLFLAVASIVLGAAAVLLGPIPPRGNWSYRCAQLWSHGLLWCSGIRIRVRRAPPETGGPFVYMANHQSLFDIPVLIATLPGQSRFMAKRSLFLIPFFGWALWVGGFIPVDRRDRSRASEAFAAAGDRLRHGHSVVIFPEETRSRDGGLLPFQRGGFLVALKNRAPIVPVGIQGTFERRPRGSLAIRPGEVEIGYGEPIEVSKLQLREKRQLVAFVEAEVARLSGQATSESTRESLDARS